jgi:RND family efflux transporter MFP subunit
MLVLAITGACGSREPPQPPPLPVTAYAVTGTTAGGQVRYSASIRADVQVDVAFRVAGYVESILQVRGADGRMRNVQDGDFVQEGTALAQLRTTEYRDQVAEANANVTQARAEFDRIALLFENRSASRSDYDAASTRVAATRARYDQAAIALADATLRAPMSGTVLNRSIEVGSLVGVGAPGFTLADTRQVKAVFGVTDILVAGLRIGTPQAVTAEAVPGVVFHGRITRVSPAADPGSRVFEAEVTIPNPDGRLRPGMIAAIEIAAADAAAAVMVVPLNAIVRPPGESSGYAVYVIEGDGEVGMARLRRVELGDVTGNMIGITAGLAGGDRVILRGATLVSDSQAVRIIP